MLKECNVDEITIIARGKARQFLAAPALTTFKKHVWAMKRFSVYCTRHNLSLLPVSPDTFTNYCFLAAEGNDSRYLFTVIYDAIQFFSKGLGFIPLPASSKNIVKVRQRQFWKQKKQSSPFRKQQVPTQNLYHPYQVHQACVLAIGTDCYCRYNCLRNLDISKTYANRNKHTKYFEVFFSTRKWRPNETCVMVSKTSNTWRLIQRWFSLFGHRGPFLRDINRKFKPPRVTSTFMPRNKLTAEMRRVFAANGLDGSKVTSQGIRRGGNTSDAEAGVPRNVRARHGGWKDDQQATVYDESFKLLPTASKGRHLLQKH